MDLFAITETWLSDADSAIIAKFVPTTHRFFHFPRVTGRGGGVGLVVRNNFSSAKAVNRSMTTFECLEFHLFQNNYKILINVLYRPPQYRVGDFLLEFEHLLMENVSLKEDIIYVGDFNLWIDALDNSDAAAFGDLLESYNLKNIVNKPTYRSGHILDLVIVSEENEIVNLVDVEEAPTFSDHIW